MPDQSITGWMKTLIGEVGARPALLTFLASWALLAYLYLIPRPLVDLQFSAALFGVEDSTLQLMIWGHLLAVILLFLLPAIAGGLIAAQNPLNWGLSVELGWQAFALVQMCWLVLLPGMIWISGSEQFSTFYPRPKLIGDSIAVFLIYQALFLIRWISLEFFFRGFLLFAFEKYLGARAILLSALPYAVLHYGKPPLEAFVSVIAGFLLCAIALRYRSIWPCVLLHWQVAMTMDFLGSSFWR